MKFIKRLFQESHCFDGPYLRFISAHDQLFSNPDQPLLKKTDLSQIKKDVDRLNLHPILKSKDAHQNLLNILVTFVASSSECNYIQGIDTIAAALYVMGSQAGDSEFLLMIPSILR